jgi:hypothetical protein
MTLLPHNDVIFADKSATAMSIRLDFMMVNVLEASSQLPLRRTIRRFRSDSIEGKLAG